MDVALGAAAARTRSAVKTGPMSAHGIKPERHYKRKSRTSHKIQPQEKQKPLGAEEDDDNYMLSKEDLAWYLPIPGIE